MSESASILEKGISRNFRPVDRLRVNNQGEGFSFWVPADGIELSSLTASENGLFLAFEDECDAYDEIEVDVPEDVADTEDKSGKISGKDPNDGNDYEVGLDDDGNLTTEKIPSAIHIVVPPTKRKYLEGETLDFSGIHVYLMDGNNHRYTDSQYPTGEIPFDELIFPVTIAEGSGGGTAFSDLFPDGIHITSTYKWKRPEYEFPVYNFVISPTSNGTLYKRKGENVLELICASERAHSIGAVVHRYNQITGEEGTPIEYYNDYSYTHNNKTVWYNNVSYLGLGEELPEMSIDSSAEAAWTLVYGTIEEGKMEVPVQWMRSDGKILEDTFTITVVSEDTGEDDPPQPDPWAGYADVSYNGHHYNLNRRIVPEVHYANGYLWQEGISTEYNVEQAASMGWLILIR